MMPNTSAVRKRTTDAAEPWLTVRQAAQMLDCAPQTVYSRAARGELEVMWIAARAFISRESVERALAAQGA